MYVSGPTSPPVLWLTELPCCHVHPVKHFIDAAFPIDPGFAAVFRVSAVNEYGESALSEPVGIVLAQTVSLYGSVP